MAERHNYLKTLSLPEDLMFHIPVAVGMHSTPGEYLSHLKSRLETAYNLAKAQTNKLQVCQWDTYNRTVKGEPFTVGDLVLLQCPHVPRGLS